MHRHNLPGQVNKQHGDYSKETCLKICKKDLTEARGTLPGALSITDM